jgi:predicted small lipoprotein YifL
MMKESKGIRKPFTLLMIVILLVALSACGKDGYPGMPADATGFPCGTYVDAQGDTEYATIEYEGRTYLLYGTANSNFHPSKDVDACIGYVIEDSDDSTPQNDSNTDARIYTLTADPDHNYLLQYAAGAFMEQPSFLRALDTRQSNITTPDYMDSLEYDIWE